VARGFS
jgi:hypothetical protein